MLERVKRLFSGGGDSVQVDPSQQIDIRDASRLGDRVKNEVASKKVDAAQAEKDAERLRDSIKQAEEFDAGEELRSQKQEMDEELFGGELSLYNMYQFMIQQEYRPLVSNYDGSTVFGVLYDINFLTDGRISVKVEGTEDGVIDTGEVDRVVTDSKLHKVFANPGSLSKQFSTGVVSLNVDENMSGMPNTLHTEVPDVRMTSDGFEMDNHDREPFIKKLQDKEKRIRKLHGKLKEEKQMRKEEERKRMQAERDADVASSMVADAQSEAEKRVDQATSLLGNYSAMYDNALAESRQRQAIENLNDQLVDQANKVDQLVSQYIHQNEVDVAKEQLKDMLRFLQEELKEEQQGQQMTQQLPQQGQQQQQGSGSGEASVEDTIDELM